MGQRHVFGEGLLTVDPLSFRGITQIHGAACETLDWATRQVEAEINAAVDNLLVDLDRGEPALL